MTDFTLNEVGTINNPWKPAVVGEVVIVGKSHYDSYKRRPPLPRVPTGQFAVRIPKTVKHYGDAVRIAWEATNPRVPFPVVLHIGRGSVAERGNPE